MEQAAEVMCEHTKPWEVVRGNVAEVDEDYWI